MNVRQIAVISAVYAASALALDLVSSRFISVAGLPIWYLPAGLYMAAVLLLGWRALPLAFISSLFSFVVSMQGQAVPMKTAFLLSLLSMAAPAIVLMVVRQNEPLPSLKCPLLRVAGTIIIAVLGGVAVESMATGTAYVLGVIPNAGTFWEYVACRWISYVLPCITLTPALVLGFLAYMSREEFQSMFAAFPVNFVLIKNRTIAKVNDRFCQFVGYRRDELLGMPLRRLYESDEEHERVCRELNAARAHAPQADIQTCWRRKDGTKVDVWINAAPLCPAGSADDMAAVCFDISARRKTEEHLIRGQKMEALGTLTGGIAHDLNNILAAIFGFVELAKMDVKDSTNLTDDLNQAQESLNRAKDLVWQIQVFSRGAVDGKHSMQISLMVEEALKLLRSTIPVSIKFRQNIVSRARISADPTQIYQIVVNLCTNAYQAMGEKGGTLDVALTDVELSASTDAAKEAPLVKYALLEVTDTGVGMDEKVKARIFDPYFTTKDAGTGTGLGLAVVKEIVRDLQGTINVTSAPGEGTTFRVYLPVLTETDSAIASAEPEMTAFAGTEHILFVDDEEAIVQIASRILPRYGYRVTICRSGQNALQTFSHNPRQFDIVFTDMAMPQMGGQELAKLIRAIQPTIPIVLCSGYNEMANRDIATADGMSYLQKPVKISGLLAHIRAVLDSNAAHTSTPK